MAATSPSPNSSTSPAPATTPSLSPPLPSNPPPLQPPTATPPPQPPSSTPPPSTQQSSPPNPSSEPTTPSLSPPSQSSPPTPPSTPPPPPHQPSGASPPISSGRPPPQTPALSPPPPETVSPASPPTSSNSPAPPISSAPPANSPPDPAPNSPKNSPPPQSSKPPENEPPPQTKPPENSPPPQLPTNPNPPENPPPRPASRPPETSPVSPSLAPPRPAPTPPNETVPSPPNFPPKSSVIPPLQAPPPPSILSPSIPSKPPTLTPENRTGDNIGPNVPVNTNPNGNGGISTGGVIAIGTVAGIVVLAIVGLVVWFVRKPRRENSGYGGHIMPSSLDSTPKSGSSLMKVHSTFHQDRDRHAPISEFVYSPKGPSGLGNSRSLFTYDELFKATNAFSAYNLLGEGGFGSVYKGYLPDGRVVAVKELKIGGGQGEQEFKSEIEIISRVHHRHLVSLVGYCIMEHQRLLVYDYVPNNSLYYHLHQKGEGDPVLDWAMRIKIAAGAARGIAYLHEDCHPRIIHRDIKSSNILLDENFEARVSDFGLAKLAVEAQTHITTRVVGTFGYVAPEYASSGKLTEKSDVYSFGVVLLELITGRKAVDTFQQMGDESLVEWARPLLSHTLDSQSFDRLVDPRLERKYVESEMSMMIEVAAACVRHASVKRPQMGQVVRTFDSLETYDLSNGMRVGESQGFDSAQKSAEIQFFRRLAFGNQDYSSDFYRQVSLNSL